MLMMTPTRKDEFEDYEKCFHRSLESVQGMHSRRMHGLDFPLIDRGMFSLGKPG